MHLEQVLIEAATTQGIWVLLFVSLFLYTIKNNEKLVEKQDKREENYQKLLSDMTEKYAVVEDIRNSVDEISRNAFDRTKSIGKRLFYMESNHLLSDG